MEKYRKLQWAGKEVEAEAMMEDEAIRYGLLPKSLRSPHFGKIGRSHSIRRLKKLYEMMWDLPSISVKLDTWMSSDP